MTAPVSIHRPLVPILVALAGLASFSLMDGTMKAAALALGAYAAMFWRTAIGTLLVAPLWFGHTRPGARWPARPVLRLHIVRSAAAGVMALLFFDGITMVPLAQGLALSFIAPVLALYLARLLLGEPLAPQALHGSLLALAGVAVIAAEKLFAASGPGAWRGLVEILASAALYAWCLVLQRQVAQVSPPQEMAFFQNVIIAALLLPGAWWLAPPPPVALWGLVTAAAVLGTASLMMLGWAYARAQAHVLVPLEYTAFGWAAVVGWVAFDEPLTRATLAGVVLIVMGCLVATRTVAPAVGVAHCDLV